MSVVHIDCVFLYHQQLIYCRKVSSNRTIKRNATRKPNFSKIITKAVNIKSMDKERKNIILRAQSKNRKRTGKAVAVPHSKILRRKVK